VEALGNHLDGQDLDALRRDLGPTAAELGQLFPQLSDGAATTPATDASQSKLRLFESVVSLLELWAHDRGLLVVLDDIHWADESTRELLDYAARRLARRRVLLVATMRSDELDRRHPLVRKVQVWRTAGLAATVTVSAMDQAKVAEMIAVILNADEVSSELTDLFAGRVDGNPFVLEEMLREALDGGGIVRTGAGWRRGSGDVLRMPETVREAVLLRLARLDPAQIDVLRAAAVLGRAFDYELLVQVTETDEAVVLSAIEAAVSQQFVVEGSGASARYRWRHALTQEAIAEDTVVPKRQRIHSRAADVLLATAGSSVAVAGHLLGSGRTQEAAEACLRAADEAERAVAYSEAATLLERVLPNVTDRREHALLLARMGYLRWLNGEPAAAEQLLVDAIDHLERQELAVEAARARVRLGRCRWELDRPDEAMQDFELARRVLDEDGPSPDLALAYLRIAGVHAFQLDYLGCRDAAEKAVAIAEESGADFERVWARAHVALGYFGTADEYTLLDRCYTEAIDKGYGIIAGSILYNEVWDRVHALTGGLDGPLAKLDQMPLEPRMLSGGSIAHCLALLATGEPRAALEDARRATARHESLGASKFAWRSRLVAAEALLELGRPAEAAAELPPLSPGNELQDIVYDTAPRLGTALALGQVDETVELGRQAASDDALLIFPETVAYAVEGLIAGGLVDEAEAVLERTRRKGFLTDNGGYELAAGRILLARDKPAEALESFRRARRQFADVGIRIWAGRAQALAAEASALTGDLETATALFASCIEAAHSVGAVRLRDEARDRATRVGIAVAPLADEPDAELAEPDVLSAGERLVTSLFADVRGYTSLSSASSPEVLADRLTTLHRWAAAEVRRRYGIVDKFAGDAVMATFNASGARVDHAVLALEAAMALRDKAALMDLPIGIGIAVGPAIVTRSVDDANISVLGPATNLAARLQTAAAGGEILLSDEAFRRVAPWLEERRLTVDSEDLDLKGFDQAQPGFRLRTPI
jgi:class 3 adenylate cyclase